MPGFVNSQVSQSINSTTDSEYAENILYILHLQRSLVCQKCVTITYETLFAHAGHMRCPHGMPAASVPHTQTSSIGTRYSGTVPCQKTCTNHDIAVYYVQLQIDDAILCIIDDDSAILNVWDTDCHLVHKNSKG